MKRRSQRAKPTLLVYIHAVFVTTYKYRYLLLPSAACKSPTVWQHNQQTNMTRTRTAHDRTADTLFTIHNSNDSTETEEWREGRREGKGREERETDRRRRKGKEKGWGETWTEQITDIMTAQCVCPVSQSLFGPVCFTFFSFFPCLVLPPCFFPFPIPTPRFPLPPPIYIIAWIAPAPQDQHQPTNQPTGWVIALTYRCR